MIDMNASENEPRVIDWLAPRSIAYVFEQDLDLTRPVVMREGHPFTGTALSCDNERVTKATAFEDGRERDSNPFPLLIEREMISPSYRESSGITDSRGNGIEPGMISENGTVPIIDGELLEGMLMFVYPDSTVMSSFSRTGLVEHLWLQDEFALEYKGVAGRGKSTAQISDYLWNASGCIEEYCYIDNTREEYCSLHTGSGFKLRSLDVSGRTTLHSDAPRHKFERFGSLRRVEQLEGLTFDDRFFIGGNGVDEHVLNYLLTLLPRGKPRTVECMLDLCAHPHAIARFLAATAASTVHLTSYRQPDPTLLDAVRNELGRLRPDLSIEDE